MLLKKRHFLATLAAAAALACGAAQSKTPLVVMAAATSSVTEASPSIVRSSFTVPQAVTVLADWAIRNNIKKVVSLVSDYAPGVDSERYFNERFAAQGGQVIEAMRAPDFAPFLQKVRDAKLDALFTFVPSGVGSALMKQFAERGLDKAGIRMIAEGSVTDDDILNSMGDVAVGVVTSHHYSAAHDSALNKQFVAAFAKANGSMRPNFMGVGGYDGMHLIMEAAKASKGAGGDALLAAMKGLSWESPQSPVSIDPATRNIVQNIYVRRVAKVGSELYNTEFETVRNLKDPGKAGK